MLEKEGKEIKRAPRLMLVGHEEPIYLALCDLGLRPVIWVRPGGDLKIERDGKTMIYNHTPLKFAGVPAVFSKSIPYEMEKKVFDLSYPFFLRNFNKQFVCKIYNGTSWMDKNNILYMMINFYYELFRVNKITHIAFCSYPHGGANIALYFLAKEMGIETIITDTSWVFPGFHFHVRSFEDIGYFKTAIKGDPNPEFVLKEEMEVPFHMQIGLKGHYRSSDPFMKIILHTIWIFMEVLYHGGLKAIGFKNKFKKKARSFCTMKNRIKMILLLKRYKFDESLFSQDYVYFPLHFQPEATGETLGWDFADQLLAVENLRRQIPEDVAILVKENPMQGIYAREQSFFKRLGAIPNTHYVPPHVDSFMLIRKSVAVATLLGTAGWEALQMGKPVICFGLAWYRSFPGVFNWNDGIDWDAIRKYKFDREKIEEHLQEHSRYYRKGLSVLKNFKEGIEGFDEKEHVYAYARSLKEFILAEK